MLQKISTACGIRRPRSGKVAIQCRGRHPETVGNIADGNIGIGEQRPRNVEVVLGQLRAVPEQSESPGIPKSAVF